MQFLIRLGLFALATTVPTLAQDAPIRVAIPRGLTTSDVVTSDAPQKPGYKYVTIDAVRLVNPSRHEAQSYEPKDFHLLAQERTYLPSARPGLLALDLHQGGVLAPASSTTVTVTFLVPASLTSAKFEFTPHWTSDAGFEVDWCCDYS